MSDSDQAQAALERARAERDEAEREEARSAMKIENVKGARMCATCKTGLTAEEVADGDEECMVYSSRVARQRSRRSGPGSMCFVCHGTDPCAACRQFARAQEGGGTGKAERPVSSVALRVDGIERVAAGTFGTVTLTVAVMRRVVKDICGSWWNETNDTFRVPFEESAVPFLASQFGKVVRLAAAEAGAQEGGARG